MMVKLNHKGDTIVEVLIAMAVVSAVLAGAFVSSNRSLIGTRRSEERAQGTKIAEGQMARLLAAVESAPLPSEPLNDIDPAGIFLTGIGGTFCLNDNNRKTGTCSETVPGGIEYRYGIKRTEVNTFRATVKWDKLGSGGTQTEEEVSLAYRVYKKR